MTHDYDVMLAWNIIYIHQKGTTFQQVSHNNNSAFHENDNLFETLSTGFGVSMGWRVLRFSLDGGMLLKLQHPYQSLWVILAGKVTHFKGLLSKYRPTFLQFMTNTQNFGKTD